MFTLKQVKESDIMGILSKVIKCNKAIITSWQQLQGGIKIQESHTAYNTKKREDTDQRKTKIQKYYCTQNSDMMKFHNLRKSLGVNCSSCR